MRKTLIVAVTAMLFVAQAFAAGPISFGLQATGANLNVTGLTDVYGFGFGGGAHLDVSLPLLISFRLQGDYVRFSPDAAKYTAIVFQNPSGLNIEGGAVDMISGHVSTKLNPLPLPLISPYLTAGLGITNISVGDIKVTGYTGPPLNILTVGGGTNTAANLGAGVDLDLIALKLYLEARYTWIFSSGSTSTYIPVSLGITF